MVVMKTNFRHSSSGISALARVSMPAAARGPAILPFTRQRGAVELTDHDRGIERALPHDLPRAGALGADLGQPSKERLPGSAELLEPVRRRPRR
jgi:hypothetical protein